MPTGAASRCRSSRWPGPSPTRPCRWRLSERGGHHSSTERYPLPMFGSPNRTARRSRASSPRPSRSQVHRRKGCEGPPTSRSYRAPSRHPEVANMAGLDRIAFIGLGIMGGPMARNLRQAGFELSVYNRTREKAERFAAEHGARVATTPADAAEGVDALITIVPDAPQVEEVLFGDHGAAAALSHDALVIDMSTTSPSASRAIAGRLAPHACLEGPVSASKPGAESGTLTIFAGGERGAFERALPLFEVMGERIVLL